MNAAEWNPEDCTTWCKGTRHSHIDRACWDEGQIVVLTLEDGFPRDFQPDNFDAEILFTEHDPTRIGVYAYRRIPGALETVKLHLYRDSKKEHLALDAELDLTKGEAIELARYLLDAAGAITTSPGDTSTFVISKVAQ